MSITSLELEQRKEGSSLGISRTSPISNGCGARIYPAYTFPFASLLKTQHKTKQNNNNKTKQAVQSAPQMSGEAVADAPWRNTLYI